MSKFMNSLYTLITTWQPLVWILVVVALFIIGIMFIVPSQKSKDEAKSHIGWVIIGAGAVLGATVLAKEITGAFSF